MVQLRYALVLVFLQCAVADRPSFGADKYWTASSSTSTDNFRNAAANWSTSARPCTASGNATVPTQTDRVFFTVDCNTNAFTNGDVAMAALTMTGYTGTFNLNSHNLTITGDITLPGGALLNAKLVFDGTVAQSFNIPSGGIQKFLDVTLSSSVAAVNIDSGSGNLIVTGPFDAHNGRVDGGTLELQGATNKFNSAGGATNVLFSGSTATQNVTVGSSLPTGTWTIDKLSGTVSPGAPMTIAGALVVTSGTFDVASHNLNAGSITVNGGNFTAATSGTATIGITTDLSVSAGTFMAAHGVTTIGRNFIQTGGTFTHNSGTAAFSGSNPTIDALAGTSGGTTFNNTDGPASGTITLLSGMLISHGLFSASGPLTVSGGSNFVQDCSTTLTAGVLTLSGGGNYLSCNSFSLSNTAQLTLASISVGSGSTFDFVGVGASITLSGNVTNDGNLRIYGGLRQNSGTPLCGGTLHVTLTSSGTSAWSGSGHFVLGNILASNQSSVDPRVLYGASQLGANMSTSFTAPGTCPGSTPVTLTSFTAESYPGAVILEWKSGHELNNLGYRVYREEAGLRVPITPSLVAGSALFVGNGIPLTAGRQYSWIDAEGRGTSPYWLEDVDLAGHGTWYGPIYPKSAESADSVLPRAHQVSQLLNRLGHASASPRQTHRAARPASLLAVSQVDPKAIARQSQWALASGPAIKIQVREEGWYRVSARDLKAAGLPADADPHMLQLYTDGIEQPIQVCGDESGAISPMRPNLSRPRQPGETLADNLTIEFYGRGLDTPESDLRTYWLVNGSVAGSRIPKFHAAGTGAGSPSFPFTVEQKSRTTYFAALKNGDAQSFFGPVIGNDPFVWPVAISSLDPLAPGDARIEIVLQGVSETNHSVKVKLNGADIGTVAYKGQAQQVFQTAIRSAMLREGANQVQFVSSAGDTDITLLDTIRVTYWRKYTVDGDGLQLQMTGGDTATIRGFQTPEIRVIDTTNPALPAELNGSVVRHDDGYALSVTPAAGGARTLYAFTENAVLSPVSVTANTPSSLHEAGAGAEVVMIVHPAFLDAITPLKNLRESQGRTVAVVNVEDIYDEFNFGVRSAGAIKDFLMNARAAWKIKPAFVLLVGDASFDTHNYLGFGDFDLVPTKLIETQLMRTASDDWFADADGSGMPVMAVGRLPVRTAAEAATVIRKIVNYDKAGNLAWKSKVLLISDSTDSSSDFDQNLAALKRSLPASAPVDQLVRGVVSDSQMQSTLSQRLGEGRGVVNYIGHGSVEIWRGNILTSKSAATLGNGDKLPFVVAMTCLNGFFHDLYTESLAEALLKAESGGAVAVWASSALTDTDAQMPMDQSILTTLVTGQSLTIGEAAVRAKAAAYDQDVRRSWILFGDPLTRLH